MKKLSVCKSCKSFLSVEKESYVRCKEANIIRAVVVSPIPKDGTSGVRCPKEGERLTLTFVSDKKVV